MASGTAVHRRGQLDIAYAEDSGQILRIADRSLDMQGVARGVALCAGHEVVDPAKEPRDITIPQWMGAVKALQNVHTSEVVKPSGEGDDGVTFRLAGAAAYAVQ